jgi:Zn-dependent protease with chaperone function
MVPETLLDFGYRILYRESRGSAAEGLLLYALTLVLELVFAAGARWLLAYAAVAAVAVFVDPGSLGAVFPWVFALLVFPLSLLVFLLPGDGAIWSRRLGARPPREDEKLLLCGAIAKLRRIDPDLSSPLGWYVVDVPFPAAQVHGRAVIVTRGLLGSDALTAAVAHELGHLHSLDPRLVNALACLVLWRLPVAHRDHDDARRLSRLRGLSLAPLRGLLRLAGGGFGRRLLGARWNAYWVAREYAADAYAGSLGQAVGLAVFLAESDGAPDAPYRRLLAAITNHPPVNARIERLLPWFEISSPG